MQKNEASQNDIKINIFMEPKHKYFGLFCDHVGDVQQSVTVTSGI